MTPHEWTALNRQWKREYNVAHAKFQLTRAKDDRARSFWNAVLELYN